MLLAPELEKYFNDYADLFLTPGWKQLQTEFQESITNVNSVEATKDNEDLFYRKGQLAVLNYLLNFQAFVEQGREDAESSDSIDP